MLVQRVMKANNINNKNKYEFSKYTNLSTNVLKKIMLQNHLRLKLQNNTAIKKHIKQNDYSHSAQRTRGSYSAYEQNLPIHERQESF